MKLLKTVAAAKKLAAAQTRSKARNVDISKLNEIVAEAEANLAKLIPTKYNRTGASAHFDWGKMPISYKYGGTGTSVTLIRRSSGWELTAAGRDSLGICARGSFPSVEITLSHEQQRLVVAGNPATARYTTNLTHSLKKEIGEQLLAHIRNLPREFRVLPVGLRSLVDSTEYDNLNKTS